MPTGKPTTGLYCLPVYFNNEERAVLRQVQRARGLRGGTLLKLLLHDEQRRLGLDAEPTPKRHRP